MNALTLWQPWASMWAAGIKKVETRTWSPSRIELPSKILIHAAARPVKSFEFEGICSQLSQSALSQAKNLKYPLGCIVGICTLVSAERMSINVISEISPDEKVLGLWKIGRWAWHSLNPILLNEPIKCRGNQLFWSPKPEVLNLVKLQLESQNLPTEDVSTP